MGLSWWRNLSNTMCKLLKVNEEMENEGMQRELIKCLGRIVEAIDAKIYYESSY